MPGKKSKPMLGPRFRQALTYAARLHARQTRKGTARPYIGHLLGVTAIVLEHGGDEGAAIAALLHDAVEDQGGLPRLAEIRRKFGRRVARIVEGCSDSFTDPKPPWRQRKEEYLQHIAKASADVRLVSVADKIYNAREILSDLRAVGDDVWSRFKGGKEGTLWNFRALVNEFRAAGSSPIVDELDRVVSELERLARSAPS